MICMYKSALALLLVFGLAGCSQPAPEAKVAESIPDDGGAAQRAETVRKIRESKYVSLQPLGKAQPAPVDGEPSAKKD